MPTSPVSALPVLIVQPMSREGPAYLATWLARQGRAFEVCDLQRGGVLPASLAGYSGMAIMGGAQSANDDETGLRQTEVLIRQAVQLGIPLLGHCLGGQLMARALGAKVGASPAPEIGWQAMQLAALPQTQAWFGAGSQATVCHWHYEAFALPVGATALASSAACPIQAFQLGAKQLAMQFHIEMDLAKLSEWACERSARHEQELARYPSSVQPPQRMLEDAALHLQAHQALADRIYGHALGMEAAAAR